MWTYNNSNELYHHGVLGMKWGVRRYQNKDGTYTAAGKKHKQTVDSHKDYERAHSKKDIKTMSDKELREVNNRLNMERQYKQLTTKEKSKGKKFVEQAIVGAAIAGASIAVGNRIRTGSTNLTNTVLDATIQVGKEFVKKTVGLN